MMALLLAGLLLPGRRLVALGGRREGGREWGEEGGGHQFREGWRDRVLGGLRAADSRRGRRRGRAGSGVRCWRVGAAPDCLLLQLSEPQFLKL